MSTTDRNYAHILQAVKVTRVEIFLCTPERSAELQCLFGFSLSLSLAKRQYREPPLTF